MGAQCPSANSGALLRLHTHEGKQYRHQGLGVIYVIGRLFMPLALLQYHRCTHMSPDDTTVLQSFSWATIRSYLNGNIQMSFSGSGSSVVTTSTLSSQLTTFYTQEGNLA